MERSERKTSLKFILLYLGGLGFVCSVILILPYVFGAIHRPQDEARERTQEQAERQRNVEANEARKREKAEQARKEAAAKEHEKLVARQSRYAGSLVAEDPSVHVKQHDRWHQLEAADLGPVERLVRMPSYAEMLRHMGPPKTVKTQGRILQANWYVVRAQYNTDASGRPIRLRCLRPSEVNWVFRSSWKYWTSNMYTPCPDINP